MKVYFIDDDEDLITIFSSALVKEGFQTAYSLTGTEGLEKVKTEKPDIILLDQVLPDMAGNDILKVLKADPATQAIPIILLSNFSQPELVKGAIDQGAVDYLFNTKLNLKTLF